jgi:hypothetical protein
MIKIPTLYLLGPIAALALYKLHWRSLAKSELWILGGLMLFPAVLWYYHAAQLRQQTGLTFNIWSIGQDKWGNLAVWRDLDFYRVLWDRLHHDVIGSFGLLLAAAGLILPGYDERERQGQVLLFSWAGSIVLYFFIVARGNVVHEYYQLPLVPVVAIAVGRALDRGIKTLRFLTADARLPFSSQILGPLALTAVLVSLIYPAWRFADLNYRQQAMANNKPFYEAGHSIERETRKGDLLLVGYDKVHKPELFYFADRKGWVFSLEQCDLGELERKIDLGAKYIAVVNLTTPTSTFKSGDCGRMLGSQFELVDSGRHWILYRAE